jgi:hypothetical protein
VAALRQQLWQPCGGSSSPAAVALWRQQQRRQPCIGSNEMFLGLKQVQKQRFFIMSPKDPSKVFLEPRQASRLKRFFFFSNCKKWQESFRAHVQIWDLPCIARVMVWISYPGGGFKVSLKVLRHIRATIESVKESSKNQNFPFDLQIPPTLLNGTYLHCQMTGFITIRVQNF